MVKARGNFPTVGVLVVTRLYKRDRLEIIYNMLAILSGAGNEGVTAHRLLNACCLSGAQTNAYLYFLTCRHWVKKNDRRFALTPEGTQFLVQLEDLRDILDFTKVFRLAAH